MGRGVHGVPILVISLVIASSAVAQPPIASLSSPSIPGQTGTGLIVGQVVDAGTGKPVAGAIVTLQGPGAARRVMTEPQGHFIFRNLVKGTFSITTTKAGWIDGAYGRRRPYGSAHQLDLTDGQRVGDLKITIWRFGAISGTVRDEDGEPVIGVEVRALRRVVVFGRRLLVAAGSAQTDDRGVFRVGSLIPADYLAMLSPGQTAIGKPSPSVSGPDKRTWAYPLVVYANASNFTDASRIQIASGQERTNIDLLARPVRTVAVSGVLMGAAGPIANVIPRLVTADDLGDGLDIALGSSTVRSDGTFSFFGVPEGRYAIRAQQAGRPAALELPSTLGRLPTALAADTSLWAYQPVVVGETDVADVTVVLHEGLKVSGHLEFDGTSPKPASGRLQQISVVLERAGSDPFSSDGASYAAQRSVHVTPDGQFYLTGVMPGRYFVRLEATPAGWMMQSAIAGGRDVADAPLEVRDDDVDGVVVTLTDRITQIGGVVTAAQGADPDATVVAFPADSASWIDSAMNLRRMKSARSDKKGQYEFLDLPAGEYFLAAIPDELADDWSESASLSTLSRAATRVQVSYGNRKTVDLRTIVVQR